MTNFERLTVKAGEALQAASNAARQAGNPQIEDSHLLAALLDQEEGIVVPILQKVGVNVARLRSENDAAAARLPKQSGAQPHLSRELNEVLDRAEQEARDLKDEYVSTEHLLLGLLREDGGAAATVLKGSGVDPDGVRASIEGIVGRDEGDAGPMEEPITPRAKGVLRLARREAPRLDHDHVGPEHLLLGLIRDAEEGEGLGVAARVLEDMGVDRREVRRRVHRELGIEE